MPCRITRKQQITLRIILESKLYEYNSFVTLTIENDKRIPYRANSRSEHSPTWSVEKVQIQKFLKRLREKSKIKFRYFVVGEYGDDTGREHYHLILFGYAPFFEEYIQDSWPYGFCQIDHLLPGGASYCAGYTTKKLTSTEKLPNGKEPEFSTWSRGRKNDSDIRFQGSIGYGYCTQIIANMTRDKLNFVGEDYTVLRIQGMLLPLDEYMKSVINRVIGYTPLEKSYAEYLRIDKETYKNMRYPEAENDLKFRSERKAKQKIMLQKAKRKL